MQQTFTHAKPGKLQFAVGFEGAGAKLRLLVTSPSGEKLVHEDAGTFIVEIDNAAAGAWRYTVAALETPYPNFPYTLIIGESAAPKSP